MKGPYLGVLRTWEKFTSKTLEIMDQKRPRKYEFAPFDRPDYYLMRVVYQFVKDYRRRYDFDPEFHRLLKVMRGENGDRWLLTNLDMVRNPYHGVLFGLRDESIDGAARPELSRVSAWRKGRALQYAEKHHVPGHFLVGFILQSGGIRRVAEKAGDPGKFEDWYHALQLKDDA